MAVRAAIVTLFLAMLATSTVAAEALPSWNDGRSKLAIMEFVQAVTEAKS